MTTNPVQPLRLAVFTLALLIGAAPSLAEPVGFVTTIEGITQIQPQSTATWEPASVDGDVSVGDSIRTQLGGRIKILLVDDTILTIAEDTELFIDRMVVGDLATQERSILRQMRGQVRAQVGRAFGGTTRLEIHTPTAIVGVRGSTMNVKVQRSAAGGWETVAAIQEGTGFACGDGGCVDLQKGQMSTIPEGGLPGSAEPIPTGFDNPITSTTETITVMSDPEPDVGPTGGVAASGFSGGDLVAIEALDVTNTASQKTGASEGMDTIEDALDNPLELPPVADLITPDECPTCPTLFGFGDVILSPNGDGDPPLFGPDPEPETSGDLLFGGTTGGIMPTPGSGESAVPAPGNDSNGLTTVLVGGTGGVWQAPTSIP